MNLPVFIYKSNLDKSLPFNAWSPVEVTWDFGEYMKFSSGSIMLDVWNNKKFYVFQFEPDRIGFSEVDEKVGFDTTPDKVLLNSDLLKLVLTSIV